MILILTFGDNCQTKSVKLIDEYPKKISSYQPQLNSPDGELN